VANTEIKSRAYQALVRPKLEYSCSVWDPHTKDQQQKLEKLQHRVARYVQNNYDYTSSTMAMINTLQWPTLAEHRLKTRLVLFYKIVHCLVAIPLHILVPTDSRTRQNHLQTFKQIQTKDTYILSSVKIGQNLKSVTILECTVT
jgi:hypothetical protein